MTATPVGDAARTRVVDVAVGVVLREDRKVLFGQRLPGKPYAGWWELPGGKLEPGETVEQALARELDEELGIVVRESAPWVVREFVYPHAHVRLHFQRVFRFEGSPRSREGQALAWCAPQAIEVAPLLPAAIPVIGWLRLASRYAISDAARLGEARFLRALDDALGRGLALLQLREKALDARAFERLFEQVLARCRAAGARLLVNSDHPASFWQAAGGVHLTSRALAALDARPRLPCVAASCHDAVQLARAGALELDFAVLGPVSATASHPGVAPLGWPRFAQLAREARLPVFALGGLGPADEAMAQRHGAHGIAMLRAAWAG